MKSVANEQLFKLVYILKNQETHWFMQIVQNISEQKYFKIMILLIKKNGFFIASS
jgi:hypothetical protein